MREFNLAPEGNNLPEWHQIFESFGKERFGTNFSLSRENFLFNEQLNQYLKGKKYRQSMPILNDDGVIISQPANARELGLRGLYLDSDESFGKTTNLLIMQHAYNKIFSSNGHLRDTYGMIYKTTQEIVLEARANPSATIMKYGVTPFRPMIIDNLGEECPISHFKESIDIIGEIIILRHHQFACFNGGVTHLASSIDSKKIVRKYDSRVRNIIRNSCWRLTK